MAKRESSHEPQFQATGANLKLFLSVEMQDVEATKRALENGANPNIQDMALTTPLIASIMCNRLEQVETLLLAGADPNLPDLGNGHPPLSFAIQSDNFDIAKRLLGAGADPFWTDPARPGRQSSLVDYAREHQRDELVQLLLQAQREAKRKLTQHANEEAQEPPAPVALPLDAQRVEAIGARLESGRLSDMARAMAELAEASLSRSAPREAWTAWTSRVAAGLAKAQAAPKDLARSFERLDSRWTKPFLFDANNPRATTGNDSGSPFDQACAHGRVEEVAFWAKAAGPDWNPDGASAPIAWAIYGRQLDTARLLLNMGANPNGPAASRADDAFHASLDAPIHVAILENQLDIGLELLRFGARATGAPAAALAQARAKWSDAQAQSVIDAASAMLQSDEPERVARGAGAMIALAAQGWTSDEDFDGLAAKLISAKARFGEDFVHALEREAEASAHAEVEFSIAIERRGPLARYRGSVMDAAAGLGDASTLRFLAEAAGPDWNPEGDDRPIDWAASAGNAKIVEWLASAGASVEARLDAAGELASASPLARAIDGGWRDAACALIDAGASLAGLDEAGREQARELLGAPEIAKREARARALARSQDGGEREAGMRTLANFAVCGWISDWPQAREAASAFEKIERADGGSEAARARGLSIAESTGLVGWLEPAASSHPLRGSLGLLSSLLVSGARDEALFFATLLGPDFRHVKDNGSALANAVALGESELARELVGMGAGLDGDPAPLSLAARRADPEMFLFLAGHGAKPSSLSQADRDAIAPALSTRTRQQALAALLPQLPAEESGFDDFLQEGSIPSATMASLVRAGQLERFWRNRHRVDWSRDASPLIEAALDEGEAGLGAYAKFRRALAADDIPAAVAAVGSTTALLASLSKRMLADEAILAALGPGRSELMRAMSGAHWPMESTMREHAAEALRQAALAKDQALFEHLLPFCPGAGSVSPQDQGSILRSAWKLGGAALAAKVDEQLGGIDPEALGSCRDIFVGPDGERAFCDLALSAARREAGRSRALDREEARAERRDALFELTCEHWSGFSPDQKRQAAIAVASWQEPGLWERLSAPSRSAPVPLDGPGAFHAFCFGDPALLRQLLQAAGPTLVHVARQAQIAAALADDPALVASATSEAGVSAHPSAVSAAGHAGSANALKALLPRLSPSDLEGFFSQDLIPRGAHERARALSSPDQIPRALPDWAMRELCDAGASFAKADLGAGVVEWITPLANLARGNRLPVATERSYSTLALRGAIPEGWMTKEEILNREPSLLEHALDADKDDPALVKAAVGQDGLAMRHASPAAKATLALAAAACAQTPDAIHCLSPKLVATLGLTVDNCATRLKEAMETSESINPLKLFARKAVATAERQALEEARAQMANSAKAKAIDFATLERGILGAGLGDADRAKANEVSARARAIRHAFERSGKIEPLDMADLRRIVERNLPDLLRQYAATDPSLRDRHDDVSRGAPNELLRKGFDDALSAMRAIAAKADDTARVGLLGESLVLGDKAAAADVLERKREAEWAQTEQEIRQARGEDAALGRFGQSVSAAESAAHGAPAPRKPHP